MSENSSSSSTGIGFTGLLTIVFIVLKLTHVIDWGWFWVVCPIIFGFGITLIVLGIVFVIAIITNS